MNSYSRVTSLPHIPPRPPPARGTSCGCPWQLPSILLTVLMLMTAAGCARGPEVAAQPALLLASAAPPADSEKPGCNYPRQLYYPDTDGDGFGNPTCGLCRVHPPSGYVAIASDCDDRDSEVHPGATERCNGKDDNCDGQLDEGLTSQTWFRDRDEDGFGDPTAPLAGCAVTPGYVQRDGDCDDNDRASHPGALEACDGHDNDCDGERDETFTLFYADRDDDGFGSERDTSCTPATGYLLVRGDCDDALPAVHPGASDPDGDGVDQDCGGTNGPDPSVGLGAGALTLQQALDQAVAGDTIWVGPGTYQEHNLTFGGKALSLRSTHLATNTVIDAANAGRGFIVNNGEGTGTRIDGFTLTHGLGGPGGGMFLSGSSPTIVGCIFTANSATPGPGFLTFSGGGLALSASNARIIGCTFDHNAILAGTNRSSGAAIYLVRSDALITDCTFIENKLESEVAAGAAIYAESSRPVITNDVFVSNSLSGEQLTGAGIALNGSDATLERCTFTTNTITSFYGSGIARGAGLHLQSSSPSLHDLWLTGNTVSSPTAQGQGGGMYLTGSSPLITNLRIDRGMAQHGGGMYLDAGSNPSIAGCVLTENTASGSSYLGELDGQGGGLAIVGSSPSLRNCTVVNNHSLGSDASGPHPGSGGGVYIIGSSSAPTISDSILAYNQQCNLYNEPGAPGAPSLRFTDLYSPAGGCNSNLGGIDASNLTVEPGFLTYGSTGQPDDLHLAKTSPLIDKGAPGSSDPDGSPVDLGAYGGPTGSGWDLDLDGLPDWFWPGLITAPPAGYSASDYDCNDRDPDAGHDCLL